MNTQNNFPGKPRNAPLENLYGRKTRLQRELAGVSGADASAANQRARIKRDIVRTEFDIATLSRQVQIGSLHEAH